MQPILGRRQTHFLVDIGDADLLVKAIVFDDHTFIGKLQHLLCYNKISFLKLLLVVLCQLSTVQFHSPGFDPQTSVDLRIAADVFSAFPDPV